MMHTDKYREKIKKIGTIRQIPIYDNWLLFLLSVINLLLVWKSLPVIDSIVCAEHGLSFSAETEHHYKFQLTKQSVTHRNKDIHLLDKLFRGVSY